MKLELSDDGTMVMIKYQWAKAMFDMEDLFKKQLASNHITILHPKVLCLKNALSENRQRIDMAPEAIVKINLPTKVQTASGSWQKSGIKREDGTEVVIGDFTGYIKNYNKKITDTTVVFD